MKNILVLSFLVLFGSTAFAQVEISTQGEPDIEFEEDSHDFGTIEKGKTYSHEFKFKNTGEGVLIIQDVEPSCGCTVPEYPKKPIMPGESTVIKAEFDPKDTNGYFNKSIKVKTNIPITGEVELTFKGEVKE